MVVELDNAAPPEKNQLLLPHLGSPNPSLTVKGFQHFLLELAVLNPQMLVRERVLKTKVCLAIVALVSPWRHQNEDMGFVSKRLLWVR